MRRLRENATLETEIGKTGDVIVEGHTIGRLDGFMFAPDAAEAGSEAKALQAAAQKALAGEIDARATKLAAGSDDHFALASDGTLRWMGDAVGKLTAADNVLEPRIRLVADDRLSGAPREAVQARLDLWLKAHVTKLLGPLFEVSGAEDITGIGRGIAYQLVEALGVIDRQKIATEMKDLDQASRATLRKYGVRFGAYHIYMPGMLKPAARALASLLWSLKHDNVDLAALTSAQHLAGTGRTSFPADKSLDRDAYRTLGYRLAGERAVRVDILERLADLIRPALSWREASNLPKPAGAFDGRSFIVTQAMTSLTGSAGEDFASILRALGYRMDRRPPLPAPAPAPEPAAEQQTATPEAAPPSVGIVAANDNMVGATHDAPAPAPADAEIVGSAAEVTVPVDAPNVAEQPEPTAVESEAAVAAEPAAAAVAQGETETAVDAAAPATAEGSADGSVVPATETVAVGPELIEVWRPAGRHDDRKPRHERPRHRRHDQAQPAEAGAQASDGEQGRKEHHRRDRGHRRRRHEGGHAEAGAAAQTAVAGGEASAAVADSGNARPREDRRRFQGKGKGRPDEGQANRREQRHGGGQRNERPPAQRPPPRERPIDPNSPFAKLAALKEQLESSAKEKL
jgi:ATP-dependent RNA helicase SUPV3L1/SUV3